MTRVGFHDLADFSREEVGALVSTARRIESDPTTTADALAGRVLGLLFLSPSLRTQTSFQAGMSRLGGASFIVSPDRGIHGLEFRSGVVMDGSTAEHVREAIPVLASYADVLGIRAFAPRKSLADDIGDTDFDALANLSPVPVINMESAIRHPCQSLADWKTMEDLDVPKREGKFVLSWAQHPKALPLAVAASTVHMAAMRGMQVTVLRPNGFELPGPVLEKAQEAAAESGGSVHETEVRDEALEGASILYAKSWSSTAHYGDDEADRDLRASLDGWTVSDSWFERAKPECRFMHCLPVRRGVVVNDSVIDGARSVVIRQARNRMWAQMAVLLNIFGKEA